MLTLEWIDGTPLSDLKALAAKGYDLQDLGRNVIQSFLRTAMRDGFFHADMHQGNLFVDAQGRLTAVDFGIMGRLGLKERRFLAEILYGFIKRDYRRVAEVHFEAGYVPRVHKVEDFAQAIRAIGEPIHSRTADQISMAKLLTLLFEITGLFDMKTRIELVLLQKTMVVVEGVARTLDPKLDMWTTSEPVVGAWIEQNLGPRRQIAGRRPRRRDARRALRPICRRCFCAAKISSISSKAWPKTASNYPRRRSQKIGEAEARGARLGHIALWLIAAIGLVCCCADCGGRSLPSSSVCSAAPIRAGTKPFADFDVRFANEAVSRAASGMVVVPRHR